MLDCTQIDLAIESRPLYFEAGKWKQYTMTIVNVVGFCLNNSLHPDIVKAWLLLFIVASCLNELSMQVDRTSTMNPIQHKDAKSTSPMEARKSGPTSCLIRRMGYGEQHMLSATPVAVKVNTGPEKAQQS